MTSEEQRRREKTPWSLPTLQFLALDQSQALPHIPAMIPAHVNERILLFLSTEIIMPRSCGPFPGSSQEHF